MGGSRVLASFLEKLVMVHALSPSSTRSSPMVTAPAGGSVRIAALTISDVATRDGRVRRQNHRDTCSVVFTWNGTKFASMSARQMFEKMFEGKKAQVEALTFVHPPQMLRDD